MKPRHVAAGSALVLLTGCSPAPGSAESIAACQELEVVDHPRLVAVAENVLADVEHSLRRGGTCEHTGSPQAVVVATIDAWRRRDEGVTHLERSGWTEAEGLLTSPDGDYTASSVTTREEERHHSFVTLNFSLAE